jgi:hypothetical protein
MGSRPRSRTPVLKVAVLLVLDYYPSNPHRAIRFLETIVMEAAVTRVALLTALLCCTGQIAGAAQEVPRTLPAASFQQSDGNEILQRFETYHIRSKTIYMKREVLLKACQERAEFSAWKLTPTEDPGSAEVIIEITLPFLTWEWNYQLVHRTSARVLGGGKVSALEQHQAAPLLAADLVKTIRAARGVPETFTPAAPAASTLRGLKTWRVKGTASPAGGDLTLAIGEDSVFFTDSNGKRLEISSRRILSAYHFVAQNVEQEQRLKKWEAAVDAGLGRACSFPFETSGPVDEGCPYIWIGLPIWLVGEGILRIPTEPAKHFIAIRWQDDQSVIEISAAVDARDWKEILRNLENIVNKGQKGLTANVLADPGPLRQEFETAKQKDRTIFFDSAVNIGRWPPLGPGEFRLVVLERNDARAEVLFFDVSDATIEIPRAIAVGHLETTAKQMPGIAARLREENGLKLLSEIRYDNVVLRFD